MWSEVYLGEIGEFSNGLNFTINDMLSSRNNEFSKKNKNNDTNLKIVNVKDLHGETVFINFKNLDKISLKIKKNSSYKIIKNDIFFARSSVKRKGVGVVGIADKDFNNAYHCGFIIRFRNKNKYILSTYLAYLLRSPYYRKKIINISNGSTITNINQESLSSLKIRYPDISIQKKISQHFINIDKQIINNKRKINNYKNILKVLFHDWFVNLNFPGFDKENLKESDLGLIPHNWDVRFLSSCIQTIESGKRPKGGIDLNERSIPSVGAENIRGIGIHNFEKEKYVTKEYFKSMKNGRVKNKDVALYKDGAHIGRVTYFRDDFPHKEFCVNEHVFLIRTKESEVTQNFIYLWLNQDSIFSKIQHLNTNSAQPGINKLNLESIKILLPDINTIENFDKLTEPFFKTITNLSKKNIHLSAINRIISKSIFSNEDNFNRLDFNKILDE